MIKAIVNRGEGSYLSMEGITSFGIKQIVVDNYGNTAYAIVCYPGPGAGYVVARFNDEEKAHRAFNFLLNSYTDSVAFNCLELKSDFVPPEPPEAEKLGTLEVPSENAEDKDN